MVCNMKNVGQILEMRFGFWRNTILEQYLMFIFVSEQQGPSISLCIQRQSIHTHSPLMMTAAADVNVQTDKDEGVIS